MSQLSKKRSPYVRVENRAFQQVYDDLNDVIDNVNQYISINKGDVPRVKGDLIPDIDGERNLGDETNRFKDLYLKGDTIYLGDLKLTKSGVGSSAKLNIDAIESNETGNALEVSAHNITTGLEATTLGTQSGTLTIEQTGAGAGDWSDIDLKVPVGRKIEFFVGGSSVGHVDNNGFSGGSSQISADNNTPSSALSGDIKLHIEEDSGTLYFMNNDGSKIWYLDAGNSDYISLAFDILSFYENQTTYQLMGDSSSDWKTAGQITFTASYDNQPTGMTAEVSQSGSSSAWGSNLTMSPVTSSSTTEATKYPSSVGNTISYTLTAKDSGGSTIGTSTTNTYFRNAIRYGSSSSTIGNQTEATIEALTEVSASSSMESSTNKTIYNIPSSSNYVVIAYPDRLTKPNQIRMNSGDGYVTASFNSSDIILAPQEQTGITNVTNSNSFSETFACVTSRITGLANSTNDFQLTSTNIVQNYILWGLSTQSGTYTQSDLDSLDLSTSSSGGKNATNDETFTWTLNAGTGEYIVFAYPARLGTVGFYFDGSAQEGGMENYQTVAYTNNAGYKENYYVYRSENSGLGSSSIETKDS